MTSLKFQNVLFLLARLLVGAVFAYSGFMKLVEPAKNFQAVLEQYAFLPSIFLPFLARVIPWMEWLAGMFLILGYMTRACAFLLICLCLLFIVALSGPFWHGDSLKECGCFGSQGIVLTVRQAYFLDGVNLILGLLLFFKQDHPYSLDCFLSKKKV